MQGQATLFSTNTDEWATPVELFEFLNEKFNFTIDLAATRENALVQQYMDKEIDALKQTWKGQTGFLNYPFSLGYRFVEKAWIEVFGDCDLSTKVVMLAPVRTSNKEWARFILPSASEITFIDGRLKYGGCTNSAPFPSCIIEFNPETLGDDGPRVRSLSWRGKS